MVKLDFSDDVPHINLVPKEKRQKLNSLMIEWYELFCVNKMQGGMVIGSLWDCIDGEIVRRWGKMPDHYVNTFSDFYVDDRVGFKGRKELNRLMKATRDCFGGYNDVQDI